MKGMLKVSDIHNIYYEEVGNPNGKPAVIIHGGPGGGCSPVYRQFFDPSAYRLILFDQRGCGRSTPFACLEENTTWHLVSDIETLREELGIDKWLVFGGSWGSTLSLAYSETHPDHVTELVLRGIFMIRKKEIDWFYQQGASALYPDAWEAYEQHIPEDERHDLVSAYYRRLTSDNTDERKAAALAWSVWEGSTSKLIPDCGEKYAEDDFSLAFARIECHYFKNSGFFTGPGHPEPQEGERATALLSNVDRIRHIPTVIVQGRYDIVCPMMSAWDLHRAFPEAELNVIDDAGHNCFELGIMDKLLGATDGFRPQQE